jgi:hypothetical protein
VTASKRGRNRARLVRNGTIAAMRRALEAAEAEANGLDYRLHGEALRMLVGAANAERDVATDGECQVGMLEGIKRGARRGCFDHEQGGGNGGRR